MLIFSLYTFVSPPNTATDFHSDQINADKKRFDGFRVWTCIDIKYIQSTVNVTKASNMDNFRRD